MAAASAARAHSHGGRRGPSAGLPPPASTPVGSFPPVVGANTVVVAVGVFGGGRIVVVDSEGVGDVGGAIVVWVCVGDGDVSVGEGDS